MYGPLLQRFPGVELVAVWGRREAAARGLGQSLGAPAYTYLYQLIRETAPPIGIVSVAYPANGETGLMAVEYGRHVLLESPLAHTLSEADAIPTARCRPGWIRN